jgi:hypothetical protein
MISPDGRWLTYLSNKAGPYEIFVRPFPDVDRREWQVSANSGYDARWNPAGGELLYRVGSLGLVSVPYETEPDFQPGTPRLLFEHDFHDSAGSSFALSPDGRRIAANLTSFSLRDRPQLRLVQNWGKELRRLAPPNQP